MIFWTRICLFLFLWPSVYQQEFCKKMFTKCERIPYKTSVYYAKTDSCYLDFTFNFSYEESRDFCRAIGMHLVTIFSPEEQYFLAKNFSIGKEGRWLALKQENGDWYWTDSNGKSKKALFTLFKEYVFENLTRAITQYKAWKARSENERYRFICKAQIQQGSKSQEAHFERITRKWSNIYRLNKQYETINAVSCGHVCLQNKCCIGFTFMPHLRICRLYQKAPGPKSNCLPCDLLKEECYIRN